MKRSGAKRTVYVSVLTAEGLAVAGLGIWRFVMELRCLVMALRGRVSHVR